MKAEFIFLQSSVDTFSPTDELFTKKLLILIPNWDAVCISQFFCLCGKPNWADWSICLRNWIKWVDEIRDADDLIIQQIQQAKNDTCSKRYFLHPRHCCLPPGCGQKSGFEAIYLWNSFKSTFWAYRTGMHVLISRSFRDVCSPWCSVSLTNFHPALAAVLMPALYHSAPEGQAGSSTSDDLNATNSSYSIHPFRILSAAFKWTLNQVGSVGTCEHLSWKTTSDCLSANRTGRKTGRKTGRDSEWQGENVERQLLISHQEPVHASEVIITTCSLSIFMMNYLKKTKQCWLPHLSVPPFCHSDLGSSSKASHMWPVYHPQV